MSSWDSECQSVCGSLKNIGYLFLLILLGCWLGYLTFSPVSVQPRRRILSSARFLDWFSSLNKKNGLQDLKKSLNFFRVNGFPSLLTTGSLASRLVNQHLRPAGREMNSGSLYWRRPMQSFTVHTRRLKVGSSRTPSWTSREVPGKRST